MSGHTDDSGINLVRAFVGHIALGSDISWCLELCGTTIFSFSMHVTFDGGFSFGEVLVH